METPCKNITRNNEKRRYEKKTETEKNRADTILVFLLQHTSEYRIIFLHVPLFLLLLQSPNSQLRKKR